MKHFLQRIFLVLLPGIIFLSFNVYADSTDNNQQTIIPAKIENGRYPLISFSERTPLRLSVGESKAVEAFYWVARREKQEVTFTYQLEPTMLGSIDENGLFTAENPGMGEIIVSYDSISARRKVMIRQQKDDREPQSREVPNLKIATKFVNIGVGEFVELAAIYTDTAMNHTAVQPKWSVYSDSLGHFEDSLFIADNRGKGYIKATYEGVSDSIRLLVRPVSDSSAFESKFRIVITPEDTTVSVGDSIQFKLVPTNKSNQSFETIPNLSDSIQISWSLVGQQVGTMSENGLFVAEKRGFGIVKAMINDDKAITTRIMVNNTVDDSTGLNQVSVSRVLPNGVSLPSRSFTEGGTFRIGGLPFPLNLLNGGLLHFPVGSLKEDLDIFMMLPERIKEDSTKVTMADSIVSGVKFVVMVENKVVSPYYFDTPLVLSLPYKAELLDSLGLSPEDLGLFFALDSTYTGSGIQNIVVDTVKNRIIADVEHFSSLVIRKVQKTGEATQAKDFETKAVQLKNTPNPFIDATNIQFSLNEKATVQLSVYNMAGQVVKTYRWKEMPAGDHQVEWNATDHRGGSVKPGIYIGHLTSNTDAKGIVKMIKLGM